MCIEGYGVSLYCVWMGERVPVDLQSPCPVAVNGRRKLLGANVSITEIELTIRGGGGG